MRVKLLKDVLENGQVKTTLRPKRKMAIAWYEGNEIELSDASGQKYVEAGMAVEVKPTAVVEVAE